MQSQDLEVLSAVKRWLDVGQTVFLCTIVETYGSSPRPAGSFLSLNEAGETVGSLSGGCIEEELVQQLAEGSITASPPRLIAYGVRQEDAQRLGLPCGGSLKILIERLTPDARDRDHIAAILAALTDRGSIERIVIAGAELPRRLLDTKSPPHIRQTAGEGDTQCIRHTIGAQVHLILLGAGVVSQYVASAALTLDYRVTVCDPREAFRERWPVDGARCVGGMPDDAIRDLAPDGRTAIVALSHDPRIDDMGLLEALESKAFFVGAMGSRRSSDSRRTRLTDLGVADSAIARLKAPVGLPIGSKTPAEIAISVIAELTAIVRDPNGVFGANDARSRQIG